MLSKLTPVTPGPVVQGRRVRVRPPALSDWPAWARIRAESRDFLSAWEPTWPADALSRTAFRRRLRRYARDARDGTGFSFVVLRRGDDRLVGGITLSNVRRGVTQSCSAGYWIGKAYARQGLMYDALTAVMDWVFDDLGLHRLEAACLPQNEPSRRLLLKCGFSEEGQARKYLMIDGAWRNHLLFAMLQGDPRPAPPA